MQAHHDSLLPTGAQLLKPKGMRNITAQQLVWSFRKGLLPAKSQ